MTQVATVPARGGALATGETFVAGKSPQAPSLPYEEALTAFREMQEDGSFRKRIRFTQSIEESKALNADPKWVEISWDEALQTIGDRLKAVRADNPKKYVMIKPNALGTTHVDALRGILDYLEPRWKGPVVIAESSAANTFAGYEQFGYVKVPAEHRNREPFDLPARWLDKKSALNLATPFNFVHTPDIVGGNSGSPVVNTAGEFVEITNPNATDVSLADFKGQVVLLNFWGLRCGACLEEMPYLEEIAKKYAGQGLVTLGVDTDGVDAKTVIETLQEGAIDDPEAAHRFLAIMKKNADRLHAIMGDHELGKLSLIGARGGMRLAGWHRLIKRPHRNRGFPANDHPGASCGRAKRVFNIGNRVAEAVQHSGAAGAGSPIG